MVKTIRTNSTNHDFIKLVKYLDADLAKRDGEDHNFYSQFNTLDKIQYVVVAYENEQPIACGAIKEYAPGIMEIKRMYTSPLHRGKGIAGSILAELETWAKELSHKKCLLETGKKQPEALSLYSKSGYKPVANYGQYAGVENSVCFEKELL